MSKMVHTHIVQMRKDLDKKRQEINQITEHVDNMLNSISG